jgi:hypothetical protein
MVSETAYTGGINGDIQLFQGWFDLSSCTSVQRGSLAAFSQHLTFSPKGVAGLSFTARIGRAISLLFTRIQRDSWCGLHCAHRATLIHIIDPSELACFSSLGKARMLVYVRASSQVTDDPSKLARYLVRDGG